MVFHLPLGITATAYQDSVLIKDSTGETETYKLQPLHIENGGKDIHLTGITAAEDGSIILVMEGKKIPEPGFHTFRVTADADGVDGPKSATEDEFSATVDLFSRILPEGAGILEVSPESAAAGSKQTLTMTYTFGADFNEGWVEFALPEEITARAGQDKIIVDGAEKFLTEYDLSDDGRKVYVTGITAQKGAVMSLIIYDRTMPGPGPYIFRARSDADGEVANIPATLGTGSEFSAFFAFSEINKGNEIVESFVKAINEGDGEAALELLADNVTYVDNYMDGFLDVYQSKEDIEWHIESMLDYDFALVNEENTLRERSENVWEVKGKTIDYFTELLAQFYPQDGFTGMGYTSKYFVTDNKISYIEFLWNREDEILLDKLQGGSIGVLLGLNDKGEGVISVCLPGLPAEKAGLRPGDVIVAVNGINVEDMDYGFEEAAFRIRGKAGTTVKLTINRDGKVFDVQIERIAAF
ncbi:MAG: BslA/BslB family hydrophobin [Bacillota bacterium]